MLDGADAFVDSGIFVLSIIDSTVHKNIEVSSGYVGIVPSSYGSSNLYVFNSGTNEAVMQIKLNEDYKANMDELKDILRKNILSKYPQLRLSFEPIELTEKIMAQGAATPIEVRIAGKNYTDIKSVATKLVNQLQQKDYLRDVQIAQPQAFPVINITIDRYRLAQMGLKLNDVARSITDATSSSRFKKKING